MGLDTVAEPARSPVAFLLIDNNPLRLEHELDPAFAAKLCCLKDRRTVVDS